MFRDDSHSASSLLIISIQEAKWAVRIDAVDSYCLSTMILSSNGVVV
jgi:hypothetical protein